MILVTGGAGYIGSHTLVELLSRGYEVIVFDNLCNSSPEVISRIKNITGRDVTFVRGDVCNKDALRQVFHQYRVSNVIHFAGLKSVSESVQDPLTYYQNNVFGTLQLLDVMAEFGVNNLIFSSSATVYGNPSQVPIDESAPTGQTTNAYGTSKYMVERILEDVCNSSQQFNALVLRYFNPIGAHESGLIGEDPKGIPNNLVPYVTQVASGKLERLTVFGNDYETPDGTGIRDYIHVVDIARGHVAGIDRLGHIGGFTAVNLGTGKGYSVLEVIETFESSCEQRIPYQIQERRPGDIASCYANPMLAQEVLGWKANKDLKSMLLDAWRWQRQNPRGYE